MKKSSLAIFVVILWVLAGLSLYYWGHKPFTFEQAVSVAEALLDLLIVPAAIVLAGGLGKRLMRLWKTDQAGDVQETTATRDREGVILQAAAGLGVMALLWLFLGVFGLYFRVTAWIFLLAGLVLLHSDCKSWLINFSSFSIYWKMGRKFDRLLILGVLFLLALQIIWAAAPPVKYDALAYHLQLPRQYLAQHRFVFVSDNPYWGHPQLGEMLFTWMMLLRRTETAALMGASWGILTLLGVMETTRRVSSLTHSEMQQSQSGKNTQWQVNQREALRPGLVAAVVLVCGATFLGLLGWAYVDLLSALMGWAILSVLLSVFENKSHKWVILAGLFCGFAIGTKWTSGIAAVAAFLVLIFARKIMKLSWRSYLLAAVLTVALVTPWLIKNVIATGSPVYPYFFSTPQISEKRLQASSAADSSVDPLMGLLFPITSTIFGWDSAPGFGADLGPLLALLAIPGLWYLRRQPAGRIILIGLGLCWATIIAGSLYFNHLQQTRLYFVLLPWAGVAAGLGWEYLSSYKSKILQMEHLLSTLLFLVLVFISIQEFTRMEDLKPLQVVLNQAYRGDYLTRATGWYFPAVDSLQDLPEGSKVLMLWESRGFFAPLASTPDYWIDRWRNDYWICGSAENILDSWISLGYTHILFYKNGAEMVRENVSVLEPEGWMELDRLETLLPTPQNFGGVYELYSLAR